MWVLFVSIVVLFGLLALIKDAAKAMGNSKNNQHIYLTSVDGDVGIDCGKFVGSSTADSLDVGIADCSGFDCIGH